MECLILKKKAKGLFCKSESGFYEFILILLITVFETVTVFIRH